MEPNRTLDPTQLDVLELIEQLRDLNSQPIEARDYARYAEIIRLICKARSTIIVGLSPHPAIRGTANDSMAWSPENFQQEYGPLMQRATGNGFAHVRFRTPTGADLLVICIKMVAEDNLFLLIELSPQDISRINEIILRGMLATNASNLPRNIQRTGQISPGALKWATGVLQQPAFGSAALTLVNEAIPCLPADFAALVWIANGSPETRAVSHIDKFERTNKQVMLLEDIAAEVLARNTTLHWQPGTPPHEESGNLRFFAESNGHLRVSAYSMRNANGDITAVLIVAYNFPQEDVAGEFSVPIALDMMQPRLLDQYLASLNTLTRARHSGRNFLEKLLGEEFMWAKVAGLASFLLLLASLIIYWPYHVEAGANFQTNSTRILSAPIDGRIDNVYATAGDTVKSGFVIATLDTHEQRLQEMEVQDQIARYRAEVYKARSENDLANSEISEAKLKEAISRKDEIDYYIKYATLKAPFDCVIVEGEKRNLLGATTKKGEQLFKLAKIENLYATLLISESDIKDIRRGATGKLVLLSQPEKTIRIHIESIIPVSQVSGQEGAKFEAIATIDEAPESWWRPGMTGIAKVDAGNRQIFWILTHKLVDLLRLKLLF